MQSQNNDIILINYKNPSNKIQIPKKSISKIQKEIPKSPERNNYGRVIPIKHIIKKQNTFDNYESFKRKPSERLKRKLSNPFSSENEKKYKTNFGKIYSLGGIPCHLQHGSSKLYLQWDIPFEKIDYFSILPICFEGIIETIHPFKFLSRQSCKELLLAKNINVKEKVIPILNKLFNCLRIGFNSFDDETFLDSCDICQILINIVKEKANPYLNLILQKMNKRCFEQKFRSRIYELCKVIEENGGIEAKKIILEQIPTYSSIL